MKIDDVSLVSALINDKFDDVYVDDGEIRARLPNDIPETLKQIAYRNSWVGWVNGLEVRTLAGKVNLSDPDSLPKLEKMFNMCADFINDWHIRHPHELMRASHVISHFGYDTSIFATQW